MLLKLLAAVLSLKKNVKLFWAEVWSVNFPDFLRILISGGFCQLVQLCSVAQQYLASNTMVHGNFCCPKFQNQSVFNRCYRVIWTPGLCLLTYRVSSALNSSNNYSKSCGDLSLLKAGSDKIIYWLGRYSFPLGLIMSKKTRLWFYILIESSVCNLERFFVYFSRL